MMRRGNIRLWCAVLVNYSIFRSICIFTKWLWYVCEAPVTGVCAAFACIPATRRSSSGNGVTLNMMLCYVHIILRFSSLHTTRSIYACTSLLVLYQHLFFYFLSVTLFIFISFSLFIFFHIYFILFSSFPSIFFFSPSCKLFKFRLSFALNI